MRSKEDVILASLAGLSGPTGILGGTFDPPHLAHVELARTVMNARGLDRVIFIPAAQNPLKADGPQASNEARLHMLYLALKSQKDMYASPLELEAGGSSYTFQTLRHIRELAPEAQLHLIIGADCVRDLPRWRNLRSICADAALVPVSREGASSPDFEMLRGVLSPQALEGLRQNYVGGFSMAISSSELRENLSCREDAPSGLEPEVFQYIREKGLYQSQ